MPERVIHLSRSQADDIAAVCSFGSDALMRVAVAIQALPTTIKKEHIEEVFADQVGDAEKARPLTRTLFGLAILHRRNFADPAGSLLASVSLPEEWPDAKRVKWVECQPALERLLSSESVVLATKAVDLSFDVERFCVGARIITDIRPIFDLPLNQISGSTIRQTLRLEYMSLNGTVSSISIGLDAGDINRLKKACDDAIQKASVVQETLTISGLEMIIPGDEDLR